MTAYFSQASLLRQIVAGPRARHAEAGLDLCYVTDHIIATSGPSDTYPQRAYRNPLDALIKFLNDKHGEDWAIWEFRAEGTGYPDDAVYNRVYHYPFPDHHPPPFALIPNIMASMRNWLQAKKGRVVVVHCKAGKGRSGTASCSYLISEEGWSVHKALQRFTERRMRPNMGKGVSIPSQLRWIDYVDRWAKHGKIYVERQVEVLEVHCWGLRDGVKISIQGFVHDGKLIKTFHTFGKEEREVVRGEVKPTGMTKAVQEVMYKNGLGRSVSKKEAKPTGQEDKGSKDATAIPGSLEQDTPVDGASSSKSRDENRQELDTADIVYRPTKRVVLPTNDMNIDIERRNKAPFDLTMVTAVAHVWVNAFFEGNGPEQGGIADESGVFEITWGAMDGIKGSSRKGAQAFEKIAVVWKAPKTEAGGPGIIITEPAADEEVKQMSPADWRGESHVTPNEDKDLGIRTSTPTTSAIDISRTGRVKSQNGATPLITAAGRDRQDSGSRNVKVHGPNGEDMVKEPDRIIVSGSGIGPSKDSTSPTSPCVGSAQLDGNSEAHSQPSTRVESPIPRQADTEGIVSGVQHVATSDLPDGRPEHEMETSKEHDFGHLARKKINSS
ncbi:hypothetical protein BDV95DRAFT_607908 [Massariosphaeria phaeospora]|uniref:phosphatidylinositol-3,4,5-trisphosphate 3-phosphatase n=1 Tax=Massariosphaeria phaeospora TaxID=100035 RepID=A0A7C8M955_9PLEO|nr:hypothetical protein BDV95DRAFT_607908 [Massariosphaeria phaeospora]